MSAPQSRVVADRYRLVEPLGQGGMGRVWKAWDELLHRDVAIKELIPPPGLTEEERQEMRERAMREARAIARLSHPNVVRIFDILRTEGEPWIVMEYVRSRSLQDVIAQDGPLPARRVAEVGLGMLAALKAAHRAGVVHRDVKPGNVLLGDNGRVVLTDFGLATVPGDPVVTRTGLVLGSPAYISPERAHDGTAGPPADMWSLGATLYAAVEGQSPYARPSAIATLAALATEPPRPARRAGPLKPVFNGLLRKNPVDRIRAEEAEKLLLRAAGRRQRSGAALLPSVRRPFAAGYLPPPLPSPASPGPASAESASAESASPGSASPVRAAPAARAPVEEPSTKQAGSEVDGDGAGQPAQAEPARAESAKAESAKAEAAPEKPAQDQPARDARTVVVKAANAVPPRQAEAGDSAGSTAPAATAAAASQAAAPQAAAPGEGGDDVTAVVGSRPTGPADRNDQGRRADNLKRAVPITLIPGLPDPAEQPDPAPDTDRVAADDESGTRVLSDLGAGVPGPRRALRDSGFWDRGFWDRGLAYRIRAAPPWAYAAVLVAVVLLAVLVVVLVSNRDADPGGGTTAESTTPAGEATPSASLPATGTAAPSPQAAPPPSAAPSPAPPGGAAFTLPRGWRTHADPSGFSVAVPPGSWRVDRDGTIVYFREQGGQGRVLGIDRSDNPKPDPVRDWTRQEAERGWTKPDYQRVRIAKVDYFLAAADWEYVYSDGGVRLHAVNRGFVTAPDQAHAILWITPDSTWRDNLDEFDVITKSFTPIP